MLLRIVFGVALLLAPLLCLSAAQAPAASRTEFWPGANYDAAVPTVESVLGYRLGDRLTTPENIVRYMEALAAYAPDRVRLFDYAKSWERRRLIYIVIGAPARIRELDRLRGQYEAFADPSRTSPAQAKTMLSQLPALVWLAYGVHGNEISSSEAALFTAYHLLASRGDAIVDSVLANTLIAIDPLQNPDGRARFVEAYEQSEGAQPDGDSYSAEHHEPWPGGRTNHYYVDMNRDWFALSQPETRGRVEALLQWLPQIYVDFHEMGGNSTYYFSPEADPYNPDLTSTQKDELKWFGRNNAKWFDKFGFNYFTREQYDAFYPGYGAGWPCFYGSIGMTYEEASTRGLILNRNDGTRLTYVDAIRHHFTTSISTLEAAAAHHDELLSNFYQYRATAVEEGRSEPIRGYVLVRTGDVSNVDALARTLLQQGIAVERWTSPQQVEGKTVPAGSYLIVAAQPMKRLIRTLLEKQVSMPRRFLQAEEERRRRKEPSEIYDVTAWSLPLQFNVEAIPLKMIPKAPFEPVTLLSLSNGQFTTVSDALFYLVPWNTAAARLLGAALQQGIRVLSNDRPFAQDGRQYPAGSLIISVQQNRPGVSDKLRLLAEENGAEVYGTSTSWLDQGSNFGSNYVHAIHRPRVMLAWDRPTYPSSAGAVRFVLERKFRCPVTIVRTAQLANSDLGRYQVLILPDGDAYETTLGTAAAGRLRNWVQSGGTLIGIGDALKYLSSSTVNLLALQMENGISETSEMDKDDRDKDKEEAENKESEKKDGLPESNERIAGIVLASPGDYEKAIHPKNAAPDPSQGVLLTVHFNDRHWLAAGVPHQAFALFTGPNIFSPIRQDKGINVGFYSPASAVVASGYLWDDFKRQIAYKPFEVIQPEKAGFVIGFTADPTFRTYMDGIELLLMNAVYRGPAHSHDADDD